jgi:radical SAM protein with 4Fe4S-binding SPASM domain
MKDVSYKNFSLRLHQKKWCRGRFNSCQFELTFGCPLHCRYCYSDCYNNRDDIGKELKTGQIIQLLDKIYEEGVFWLGLTGGDPLSRKDFPEIYTYAREKGFLVTLFTSGILISEAMADYLKKLPPFCIELTLNAIDQEAYERISGVEGSYEKVLSGINRLKERGLPFKIKTMALTQNYEMLGDIKGFLESLGQKLRLGHPIHARLNGDLTPCRWRLEPDKILEIDNRLNKSFPKKKMKADFAERPKSKRKQLPNPRLFRCAAGSDSFHIDPYGHMFLCGTVRKPSINLLQGEIMEGRTQFTKLVAKEFMTDSTCRNCLLWHICQWCPGIALLEKGNAEAPIEYFCQLAKAEASNSQKNGLHRLNDVIEETIRNCK